MKRSLGLIGAGNMAGAIIHGILSQGLVEPGKLSVSNRHAEKLAPYAGLGLFTSTYNRAVAERSEILILAVKPQMFGEVLGELGPCLGGKCVVSIAPGFSVAYLRQLLPESHIVRAMPNTPMQVGKGVTAVVEAPEVPADLFEDVVALFSAAGAVSVIPEERMNTVIALSGSSPAYFFRMADAMVRSAVRQGFDGEEALRLAAMTMAGAAEMLLRAGKTAEELTRQVCSPGGSTLAALTAFDEFGFEAMIDEAMLRCAKRAQELGK